MGIHRSLHINKKIIKKNLKNWYQLCDRMIKASLVWKWHDIEIFGIYSPVDNVQNNVKEDFYKAFRDQIDNVGRKKEIVSLADFIAQTGKKVLEKVVGEY